MDEFGFIERIEGEPHYRIGDEEDYTTHIPIVNVFEKYFIENKLPDQISDEIDELEKEDVHRIEAFWIRGGFEETQQLYEEFKQFNTDFEENGPEGFIQEKRSDSEADGELSGNQQGLEEVYDFFCGLITYDHVKRSSINRIDSETWLDMSYDGSSARINVEENDSGYMVSSNLEGEFLTEFSVDESKVEEKVREVYNSAFYTLTD